MVREGRPVRHRLVALALCGAVLLNFPLLALPQGEWFGLPGLYVYIFGAWAGLIAAAAFMLEREDD